MFHVQEQKLAAVSGARVVKPGRELVLPRINRPRVAKRAALNQRAEIEICKHMAPGDIRLLCHNESTVFRKAAPLDAKIHLQPVLRGQNGEDGKGDEGNDWELHTLCCGWSDIPRCRLQRQDALRAVRLQVHRMDSAGCIEAFHTFFTPQGGFQRIKHRLVVITALPIADGDIRRDSATAQLPVQADERQRSRGVLRILYLDIQDRMIAGDSKAPQSLYTRIVFLRSIQIFVGLPRRIK